MTSTNGTLAVLLLSLAAIYWVTASKAYKKIPVVKIIPAVFLIYFVPMLLNSFGCFDPAVTKGIYNTLKVLALPMSLILILMGTDLPLIARLGPKAIIVMVCASVGVLVGGVVAFAATQRLIDDPDLWRGVGALAGSWIGGSANMIAAKEALVCPERVYTPMVIIDIACGYGWMIVVLALAGVQTRFDKWNGAKTAVIDEINTHLGEMHSARSKPIKVSALLSMLGVSAIVAHFCMLSGHFIEDTMIQMPDDERLFKLESLMDEGDWAVFEGHLATLAPDADASGMADRLPLERVDRMMAIDGDTEACATIALRLALEAKGADPYQFERPWFAMGQVINYLAMGLIFASLLGLALSFTKLRNLEDSGASELGYMLLFLTLASLGARADINTIFGQGWYLLLGVIWIAVFAVVLFLLAKIFKAPLFLVGTASQANVGGAVSAPIVAGAYQPNLAVVGVLMAVIGQVVGTFLAIGTGWLCSLIAIGG